MHFRLSQAILFTMNRNGEIELWRFIVALVIVNSHCTYLQANCCLLHYGRIGVEFFFILSGYLLAGSALKVSNVSTTATWPDIHRETTAMLLRKMKSFFPETLISCLIACCFYAVWIRPDFQKMVQVTISVMFGNACMLNMTGLFTFGINGPTWYLSTLLICSAILFTIILRWGNSPLYLIFGWLLLGGIYMHNPHPDIPGVQPAFGIIKEGNIRGFAEMLMGVSLYPVVQRLKEASVSKAAAIVLMLVKWGACLFFLCYAYRASFIGRNAGFILLVICTMIVLMFSEKCYDRGWYRHPLLSFLGKFSLSLYLSHIFYACHLKNLLQNETPNYVVASLFYILSFATAGVVMALGKWVRTLPPLILFPKKNGN